MPYEDAVEQADYFFLGTDRTLQFTIYQADNVTVQDITGWTLEWILRGSNGAVALSKATGGNGITIVNGAAGRCDVAIADTDTEALDPGVYVHALARSNAGLEDVLTFGDFHLRRAARR